MHRIHRRTERGGIHRLALWTSCFVPTRLARTDHRVVLVRCRENIAILLAANRHFLLSQVMRIWHVQNNLIRTSFW